MEFTFFEGMRKNSKLLYLPEDRQVFKLSKIQKDKKYYKCFYDLCKATISISNGLAVYINSNHPHGDQEELYKKRKLVSKIKQRAREELINRREIFDQESSRPE